MSCWFLALIKLTAIIFFRGQCPGSVPVVFWVTSWCSSDGLVVSRPVVSRLAFGGVPVKVFGGILAGWCLGCVFGGVLSGVLALSQMCCYLGFAGPSCAFAAVLVLFFRLCLRWWLGGVPEVVPVAMQTLSWVLSLLMRCVSWRSGGVPVVPLLVFWWRPGGVVRVFFFPVVSRLCFWLCSGDALVVCPGAFVGVLVVCLMVFWRCCPGVLVMSTEVLRCPGGVLVVLRCLPRSCSCTFANTHHLHDLCFLQTACRWP